MIVQLTKKPRLVGNYPYLLSMVFITVISPLIDLSTAVSPPSSDFLLLYMGYESAPSSVSDKNGFGTDLLHSPLFMHGAEVQ